MALLTGKNQSKSSDTPKRTSTGGEEIQFWCHVCEKSIASACNLQRHGATVHGIIIHVKQKECGEYSTAEHVYDELDAEGEDSTTAVFCNRYTLDVPRLMQSLRKRKARWADLGGRVRKKARCLSSSSEASGRTGDGEMEPMQEEASSEDGFVDGSESSGVASECRDIPKVENGRSGAKHAEKLRVNPTPEAVRSIMLTPNLSWSRVSILSEVSKAFPYIDASELDRLIRSTVDEIWEVMAYVNSFDCQVWDLEENTSGRFPDDKEVLAAMRDYRPPWRTADLIGLVRAKFLIDHGTRLDTIVERLVLKIKTVASFLVIASVVKGPQGIRGEDLNLLKDFAASI